MWKTLLDLIFPINCLGCGQPGNFICFNCFEKIPLNTKPILNNLLIASYYKNPLVKQLIHSYKYDFVKDLAKPLGQLMVKKLAQQNIKNPVLIPVPLHAKRLRWRGFNQSEELALVISQKLNIPVINNVLIRTKHTSPQAKIENLKQRKINIKNSFQININFKKSLKNKNIILIDDISTTGATIEECAKTLKPLKPKTVYGLVIAKG